MLLSPTEISIKWEPGSNTGFDFTSELEHCKLDLTKITGKLGLYPMVGDPSNFTSTIIDDSFWIQ